MTEQQVRGSHRVRSRNAGPRHGQTGRRVGPWLVIGLVVIALAGAGVVGVRWWQDHSNPAAIVGERSTAFPAIDKSALDPTQAKIVAVTAQEFRSPGSGGKYAEGVSEPWCADFVSWVMREAGVPLANPNSGSWRIPGVYTLQEYYASAGRFAPIGGYQPRTGDVLMYDSTSPFGQHTNIVLKSGAGTVTTIGGNEFGEVSIHTFALAQVPGIVGFGRL
ncbi:CHAP domain-containing protein [Nocardia colli]|uniref:CHAP domain-containing protein n=1 Tax=Nocardia colli TaxID=2545717 RepID=A0A5N0EHP7_9NOCA|nr:CHAP domain-containing protein [Nocardia colli]